MDRNIQLFAEDPQLFHGCRTLQVGGHQKRLAALVQGGQGQFGGGGGFALALQAAEHDHRRAILAGLGQRGVHRTHQRHKLVVEDLEDLLAGVQGAQHLLPHGLFRDPVEKVPRDLMVHISVQQGNTNLLKRLADIGLGQPTSAPQALDGVAQSALKTLEHEHTSNDASLGALSPSENGPRP